MKISRTIPIFLISAILVFGTTISMGIPTSFAEPQYNSYGKDYDTKKTSNLNKQNVNCNNIIINGLNSAGQDSGGGDMINPMTNNGEGDGTGQWLGNDNDNKKSNGINENIVNFCKNKHNKIVLAAEEPQTGSLTVSKQIFGCDRFESTPVGIAMNCLLIGGATSDEWLSCDEDPISITVYCQNLQEDFFDIEVLDEQNNPVVPTFTGSQNGKTITDLEPGTYAVNEIVHEESAPNQLTEASEAAICADPQGFVSGGELVDGPPIVVDYLPICFQFQDEQGEDCSTTTIAAGEAKTCIVKNYIVFAQGPF